MATKSIAKEKTWLNPDPDCLAAVRWTVDVYYNDDDGLAEISADIVVTEEGRSHWVSRRAHLLPIKRMQSTLTRFCHAVEQAETWIKANGYKQVKHDDNE